jgi:hypothetical protein
MSLSLLEAKGTPVEDQRFTWRELVQRPLSKLNDDAFTRVRVILMIGLEAEALRFSHACSRMNRELRVALARLRRVEEHQRTLVQSLLGADHSPLETTIAYEQVAVEVTAAIAQREPEPEFAKVYRFSLLEDLDHLYRYSALLDRIEGKDSNNILQSLTDILPGRATLVVHRAPEDDVRNPYDRHRAGALTKLHALTVMAGEFQTHDYYATVGPLFADPIARQLYAEIASVEEQHATQVESMMDPKETWLEKWLLHEAAEAYNYYGCVLQETNPRLRVIWERMLDYELGHLNYIMELFKVMEDRDPAEILPARLPDPIPLASQREFVLETLRNEVDLRANGAHLVPADEESPASLAYRRQLNSEGSPSETVAAGYRWTPGTELRRPLGRR